MATIHTQTIRSLTKVGLLEQEDTVESLRAHLKNAYDELDRHPRIVTQRVRQGRNALRGKVHNIMYELDNSGPYDTSHSHVSFLLDRIKAIRDALGPDEDMD